MWDAEDRDQFYRQLSLLAEAMGEPVSAVRLAAYAGALEDLPAKQVGFALHDAIRECRFFPKPVEIRELAMASIAWLDYRRAELGRSLDLGATNEPPWTAEELVANKGRLAKMVKQLAAGKRVR